MHAIVLGISEPDISTIAELLHSTGTDFPDEGSAAPGSPTANGWDSRKRELREVLDLVLGSTGLEWWQFDAIANTDFIASIPPSVRRRFEALFSERNTETINVLADPRLCLLLPLVRAVIADPVVVLVASHPAKVASDGVPDEVHFARWEIFLRAAIAGSKGLRVHIVTDDDLRPHSANRSRSLVETLEQATRNQPAHSPEPDRSPPGMSQFSDSSGDHRPTPPDIDTLYHALVLGALNAISGRASEASLRSLKALEPGIDSSITRDGAEAGASPREAKNQRMDEKKAPAGRSSASPELASDELERNSHRLRDLAIRIAEQEWALRERNSLIDWLETQLDSTASELRKSREQTEIRDRRIAAIRGTITWRLGAPFRQIARRIRPDDAITRAFRPIEPAGDHTQRSVASSSAPSDARLHSEETSRGKAGTNISSKESSAPFASWLTTRAESDRSLPPSDRPGTDADALDREDSLGTDAIQILDTAELGDYRYSDPDGVVMIMPAIDHHRAFVTANVLLARAGMKASVVIALDSGRNGFIETLNAVYSRIDARYVVYLAEDAFPGNGWLASAHRQLERTGKGLLAFNDGKWHGRIAAFGMVRTNWVRQIYGEVLLHPEYRSHRADNEITVIARALDQYVYGEASVLMEMDLKKIFRRSERTAANFTLDDRKLFKHRFEDGFDGIVPSALLEPLRKDYFGHGSSARKP